MKQFILLLIVLCILACSDKKQRRENNVDTIDAKQLILIIRDSSFANFKKLINATGYPMLDSGDTQDGSSIIYTAEEEEETGNTLSATMTKDLHIYFLHFSTYKKNLYQRLRKQIIEHGFKSLTSDSQVEELEMDNVYINIIKVESEGELSYDFVFVRKNKR